MNRWLQVWNGILYPEFFTWTHTKYALILSRLNYFFTVYVSMMCRVMSPCSTKHALKPQIFKYFKYTLYGKRNFANMIKFENFSYGDYPGLLSGSIYLFHRFGCICLWERLPPGKREWGRRESLGLTSLWPDLGLKVWKFNNFDLESVVMWFVYSRVEKRGHLCSPETHYMLLVSPKVTCQWTHREWQKTQQFGTQTLLWIEGVPPESICWGPNHQDLIIDFICR